MGAPAQDRGKLPGEGPCYAAPFSKQATEGSPHSAGDAALDKQAISDSPSGGQIHQRPSAIRHLSSPDW